MNVRRILKFLGTVVLFAFVALFVIYAFPGLVGGEASYVVLSGSMEPAISQGDVVVVNDVPPGQISTGDVITFRVNSEPAPTTHRVVGVSDAEGEVAFKTKGDANEGPDQELVPGSNVIGRVMITIPVIGYLITFLDSTTGMVLFVGIPLGLLVVSELWGVFWPGSNDQRDHPSDEEVSSQTTVDESGERAPSARKSDDATVTLTRSDLRLSLVSLLCFSAYAAWHAVQTPGDMLLVTIAVGTGLLAIFVGAAYYAADGDGPALGDDRAAVTVIRAGADPQDGDVALQSLPSLLQMAAINDVPVTADSELSAYQLSLGDTVYYLEDGTTEAEPPIEGPATPDSNGEGPQITENGDGATPASDGGPADVTGPNDDAELTDLLPEEEP